MNKNRKIELIKDLIKEINSPEGWDYTKFKTSELIEIEGICSRSINGKYSDEDFKRVNELWVLNKNREKNWGELNDDWREIPKLDGQKK